MIEPEERNPWDALADELGLPPTAEAAPAPPAEAAEEPAAEVAPPGPPPTEGSPVRGRRRRGPAPIAEREQPPAVVEVEAPVEAVIEWVEVSAMEVPTPEGEETLAEAAAGEAGEEAPPKGRSRRRRRGRGRSGGKAAPEGTEAPAGEPEARAAAEAVEAPPAGRAGGRNRTPPARGRGRSRGRDKPERTEEGPSPATEGTARQDEEPGEERLQPVAGEEELDDLSNLDLPTWGELIGSLYRPER